MICSIYPNVVAEMARNYVSVADVADEIDYSESSVYKMPRGRTRIPLETAVAIKKAIGSEMPLEELFRTEEA